MWAAILSFAFVVDPDSWRRNLSLPLPFASLMAPSLLPNTSSVLLRHPSCSVGLVCLDLLLGSLLRCSWVDVWLVSPGVVQVYFVGESIVLGAMVEWGLREGN